MKGLVTMIQFARDALVKNEKKIWLKTKKGKKMLVEMGVAADGLLRSIVKLKEENYNSPQDFIDAFEKVESACIRLEEELRKRSMVVI